MFNFKTTLIVAVSVTLIFLLTSMYFNNIIEGKDTIIREQREDFSQVVTTYDKDIGEYTTSVGVLEDKLSNSQALTKDQQNTISRLQKNLNGKIEQIQLLQVQIDTLYNSGTAVVLLSPDSLRVYKVNDYKDGVHLSLSLNHPSGDYDYQIVQDPLTMEIYLTKEKKTGIQVGSIKFPMNPTLSVKTWDIMYDPDTRPWYTRFIDNINVRIGLFAGNELGGVGTLGYNRINAGYVVTEQGSNLLLMYDLK